ncbi:hypothetical protein F383_36184 [Gossypium arboreum]|uniref:Uncharacterized protein n=1 Tax=Gossypium arboreum TaxID=29729 RepID=A0A0B0N3E3_GOSAR|nr:hypothetical protein F383_36184 [Gossypium arboreum]
MKNHHLFPMHPTYEEKRKKETFFSLQFGPFIKNLPFSLRNKKNFYSHQERKMARRLWEARISS